MALTYLSLGRPRSSTSSRTWIWLPLMSSCSSRGRAASWGGSCVKLLYFRCKALRWCRSFRLGSSSSLLLHTREVSLYFSLATSF